MKKTQSLKNASCDKCMFWRVEPDFEFLGECRKEPPRIKIGSDDDGVWPTTSDDDWCGEFQPKDGE